MKMAEEIGLQEEQWGSRKKRSATSLGLDKQLMLDYAYLSKTPTGIVGLDASA